MTKARWKDFNNPPCHFCRFDKKSIWSVKSNERLRSFKTAEIRWRWPLFFIYDEKTVENSKPKFKSSSLTKNNWIAIEFCVWRMNKKSTTSFDDWHDYSFHLLSLILTNDQSVNEVKYLITLLKRKRAFENMFILLKIKTSMILSNYSM